MDGVPPLAVCSAETGVDAGLIARGFRKVPEFIRGLMSACPTEAEPTRRFTCLVPDQLVGTHRITASLAMLSCADTTATNAGGRRMPRSHRAGQFDLDRDTPGSEPDAPMMARTRSRSHRTARPMRGNGWWAMFAVLLAAAAGPALPGVDESVTTPEPAAQLVIKQCVCYVFFFSSFLCYHSMTIHAGCQSVGHSRAPPFILDMVLELVIATPADISRGSPHQQGRRRELRIG